MYKTIKQNWDTVAKPLDSLGVFEELHSRIGAINKREHGIIDKCAILVFCADNGVVAEGISQSGQEVTALCADSISSGRSCLGTMTRRADTDIITIDVGINSDETWDKVRNLKVAKGTKNFAQEPAMTKEQVMKAIALGKDMVKECKDNDYSLIGIGEMGIGNTTTSSAVAAALLRLDATKVTGRGAGLSDEGLIRKINVIDTAISTYGLYDLTPIEVLRHVGGFDIAAMVGVCLGAKEYSMPIVLDGFISMVAALLAVRIDKDTKNYLIPSHCSKEPAARLIADELGLTPVIDARMALGEGTGAALMISLLRTIDSVYETSASFEGIKVEQYERH